MNLKKRILLMLSSILLFNMLVVAQVTIGSSYAPNDGAILDLKQYQVTSGANSTKGLLLPRVQLKSATEILATAKNEEAIHTGLIVYNVGDSECAFGGLPPGVYIWNGERWNILGDKSEEMADHVNAAIYLRSVGNENLAGTIQELDKNGTYILEGHADGKDIKYKWSGPGIVAPSPSADGKYTITGLTDSKVGKYTCTMIDDCDNVIVKYINIALKPEMCSPDLDITLNVYLGSKPTVALTPNQAGKYEIPVGEDIIVKSTYDATGGIYDYKWTNDKDDVVIGSENNTECVLGSLPNSVNQVILTFTAKDKAIGCNKESQTSVTLAKKADPNCKIPDNIFSITPKTNIVSFKRMENGKDFICIHKQTTANIIIKSTKKIDDAGWQDDPSGAGSIYNHEILSNIGTNIPITVDGCAGKITFVPVGTTTTCKSENSRTIGADIYVQQKGTSNMVLAESGNPLKSPVIGQDIILQAGAIVGKSSASELIMIPANSQDYVAVWTVEKGTGYGEVNDLYDEDDYFKGNMKIRMNARGSSYPLPHAGLPQSKYRIGIQIIELSSSCSFRGTLQVVNTGATRGTGE